MNIDKPIENDIFKLKKLWSDSFGDCDSDINIFFDAAFSSNRCMCCRENNDILASLYWFDCLFEGKRIAYIYAVSTAQKHRGKGICRKLMEHTHQHLADHGYAGAILVPASQPLFEFYKNMGYKPCTTIGSYECNAEMEIISIRKIDKEEYINLRKTFLPSGGVVQESENIDYLSAQYNFYSGSDFLLASKISKSVLYGAELLGNICKAPQITYSLRCNSGKFRVPGNDQLFSMYIPFGKDDYTMPSYFGLAFD